MSSRSPRMRYGSSLFSGLASGCIFHVQLGWAWLGLFLGSVEVVRTARKGRRKTAGVQECGTGCRLCLGGGGSRGFGNGLGVCVTGFVGRLGELGRV